jgi:hypothetical protein
MESFFRGETSDAHEKNSLSQWFDDLRAHLPPENKTLLAENDGKSEKSPA